MIEIKTELYDSWTHELHDLQEKLNATIEGKKTEITSPVQFGRMVGNEEMLRKILSEISLSTADDIKNN